MKVLVLAPRGLHLGFVGCYGNDWVATPNLDRLAAEGVVFDQHLLDRPDLALAELPLRQARRAPAASGQSAKWLSNTMPSAARRSSARVSTQSLP